MTETGVKKIWDLLATMYPRQRHPGGDKDLLAWTLVLRPYDYAKIREAALEHIRASDYYPSVSELTGRLSKPGQASLDDRNKLMDEYVDLDYKGCRLIHEHDGTVGEIIRQYAPQECEGCTKAADCGILAVVGVGAA